MDQAFGTMGSKDTAMHTRIEQLEQEVRRILGNMTGIASGSQASLGLTALTVTHPVASAMPGHSRATVFDIPATVADRQIGEISPTSFPTSRARYVRRRIRQRRMREQHFASDLFADPAWDMMLDLYAAHYERRTVSVSSLCIAAAVPATTALRWIKALTDEGLFVRAPDPYDGRRIYIFLSDDSRQRLDDYFADIDD